MEIIAQAVFILILYQTGLFLLIPLSRRIPAGFILLAGFLFGVLSYILASILILCLGLPFTRTTWLVFLLLLWIGFFIAIRRTRTWDFFKRYKREWALVALLHLVIPTAAGVLNYSSATMDSFTMIMLGRTIGFDGFTPETVNGLASWGVFVPLVHSAAGLLKSDYIFAVQPTFSAVLFGLMVYLSIKLSPVENGKNPLRVGVVIICALAFYSTDFILLQAGYIHTNQAGSVYLLAAIACFWLSLHEKNSAWLLPAALSLTGFSLLRTESPLFALLILAVYLGRAGWDYRTRLWLTIPYLAVVALWYVYLLANMGAGTDILDPGKTRLVIYLYVVFGLFILLTRLGWLEKFVLRRLDVLTLVVLGLVLIVLWANDPVWMNDYTINMFKNMFQEGRWGLTWIFLAGLLVAGLVFSTVREERFPWFCLLVFFGALLAVGFVRSPVTVDHVNVIGFSIPRLVHTEILQYGSYQRLGWSDSTNRMVTHIAPAVWLLVVVKLINLKKAAPKNHPAG